MGMPKSELNVWKSPVVEARAAAKPSEGDVQQSQTVFSASRRLINEVRRTRNGVPKSPAT